MVRKKIIGHDFQKKILLNQYSRSNNWLFIGKEGVGKRSLVMSFISWLFNVDDPQNNTNVLCCTALKVEQVRELQDFLSTYSSEEYKVIVIDDIDKMNVFSQTALLRLIENTSIKVLIFLISTTSNNIERTLSSRCRKLYFSPLKDLDMIKLIGKKNIDLGLLELSAGSYGKYQQFKQENIKDFYKGLLESIAWKQKLDYFYKHPFFFELIEMVLFRALNIYNLSAEIIVGEIKLLSTISQWFSMSHYFQYLSFMLNIREFGLDIRYMESVIFYVE
ncbi:MAG: hypothetical protein P857_904 [Candidatus Xenolissoclinum pacificiensis L6]|uniref:AAA+ ATPase domain-containing protein n=1 Tax=Candidatus Xenolissoclinum pacificiensis L6 TaxID=1401685 RepID=W2V267_9RICK|nr:MAG: hypothetical protein P857_904 [Candidatus Xenolissoclinum pacificiensis L6]